MDTIIDYLKQLELSEIEAKLYLTLLQSGPISVRDLAANIDIKRTTAYLYVDQLVEKGLVIKIVKGSKKLVTAEDPKALEHLVKAKVESAQKVQKHFPDILKTLATSLPGNVESDEAEIRYYKGKNGVKKVYEEALKAKELRSYFNIELMKEALPDNEVLFVHALQTNKDIKIYELIQDSPLSRKKVKASKAVSLKHDRYFLKFLPQGITLSAADILIYDGKIGIVNVGSQFTGIVLNNKDYYNNSKELFDLVWKVLPESE
jgi:sugar-specific transcriptional regulator TrmB